MILELIIRTIATIFSFITLMFGFILILKTKKGLKNSIIFLNFAIIILLILNILSLISIVIPLVYIDLIRAVGNACLSIFIFIAILIMWKTVKETCMK
jgi:hypothetical protein